MTVPKRKQVEFFFFQITIYFSLLNDNRKNEFIHESEYYWITTRRHYPSKIGYKTPEWIVKSENDTKICILSLSRNIHQESITNFLKPHYYFCAAINLMYHMLFLYWVERNYCKIPMDILYRK